ncbi:MAG: RNA ligase family protein [Candidatus Njordarchaeota archaeon]
MSMVAYSKEKLAEIESLFDKVIKYPSIDYPEKSAKYINFPADVFFQSKYDGSNVTVWVYDGEIIVSSRRKAIADITLFQGTLTTLGEYTDLNKLKEFLAEDNIVLYCELFGRKNTPAGYHKDYPKPLDIVVFDIGRMEDGMFVDPDTAILLSHEIGLNFVDTKKHRVNNFEELINYATRYSKYEGCVIKIYTEKYRKGALMMKWKPQELATKSDELPFSEVCGVIAKAIQDQIITPDMKDKQIFRILRQLINDEARKHRLKPPSTKNLIYRAYSIVRSRILNPATIEKIVKSQH